MRILYVISDLGFGGAEKQLVELSRQLVQYGHCVLIYTLNRRVPRESELDGSGVTLVVDQKRTRLDPRVILRLRRTIAGWQPDLVHGFHFDGDLYARLAALGTGIPVLNSERNEGYEITLFQKIANFLTLRLAAGVVANSHAGKAFAERAYGYSPGSSHVVWNGLRLEQLERQRATSIDVRTEFFGKPSVRVACLVGSIKPQKDYHLALETAQRLVEIDAQWRVLFLGDRLPASGEYLEGKSSASAAYKLAVMRHHASLGGAAKIRFAGLRNDVPAIVSQCDVLFVTSRHEGFPNAVLEAMGLGVPVVSTRYSDIERILPFSEQIVASRSPEALVRAILWARRQSESIALCQKQWVRTHATMERAAKELEHVYRKYVPSRARLQPA